MNNFQSSDDQVTLEASSQSLILRNYIDNNVDLTKIIRTQINLKSLEFDSYTIDAETSITFTLKEFKALLAFAEALNLSLQIHFETTGRPVVFIVHNNSTFEAHFVLATSKPDNATQSTSTQNTAVERNKRKDTTNAPTSAKKPHLDADMSKCLDEDSHLFNFIDIPENAPIAEEIMNGSLNKENGVTNQTNVSQQPNGRQPIDCDNIPGSPTSRTMTKSLFRRCFESTYDPRSMKGVVLTENSDSE